MDNKKLRTSLTYLFMFFLSFFIFVITILTCVRFTVMSPNYFIKTMDSTDYYNNTATEITRLVKQQARGAGFDPELFAKIVKEEDILDEMQTYERNVLNGKTASVDTTNFKKSLNDVITAYTTEKNIKIDNNEQVALDQFLNTCSEKFVYLTQFPYLDVIGRLMGTFHKVYMIAMPVLIIASAFLSFILFRLQKSIRRRKKYFGITLVGAGLLSATGPAIIYAMRIVEKVSLNPLYIYNFLIQYLKSFLVISIISGIAFMVIGIVLSYVKFKAKSKGNVRMYHAHGLQREE